MALGSGLRGIYTLTSQKFDSDDHSNSSRATTSGKFTPFIHEDPTIPYSIEGEKMIATAQVLIVQFSHYPSEDRQNMINCDRRDVAVRECHGVGFFPLSLCSAGPQPHATLYTPSNEEKLTRTVNPCKIYPGQEIFKGWCNAIPYEIWPEAPL
ncbi:MAG: hypothetical protein MMC33_005066 [Icmadophila ericetorum]|nr:hypothetical protein [Icmadophila ericetorum]